MPASRIGFSPWVPISPYSFGFVRLYSRTWFLTRLPFQQLMLCPELPAPCPPVLELSFPTDDQIVYQWHCRQCGRRFDLSAQRYSSSRAVRGCGSYGAVESLNSRGVWRTSQHFLRRNLR